jgi:hypothetical protein
MPLLITDDYMLAELSYEEKATVEPYLSEEDRVLLHRFKEEDNPYLLKLYFKK